MRNATKSYVPRFAIAHGITGAVVGGAAGAAGGAAAYKTIVNRVKKNQEKLKNTKDKEVIVKLKKQIELDTHKLKELEKSGITSTGSAAKKYAANSAVGGAVGAAALGALRGNKLRKLSIDAGKDYDAIKDNIHNTKWNDILKHYGVD